MIKLKFRLFFIFIVIIYLVINCSTPYSDDEDDNVVVNDISIKKVSDKVPVENSSQIDLELLGIINNENYKQDIDYNWYIEYLTLDLDIDNNSSIKDSLDIDLINEDLIINRYLEGYYFLEVSKKNPLNALLSIYRDGFYKITLKVTDNNGIKEYSIIIKIGEPILPDLFVKVNIPKMNKLSKNDFIGKFYLNVFLNNGFDNSNTIEINANEIKDDWYDTGIIINPFESFNIIAGTHILKDNFQHISSIIKSVDLDDEYDYIGYTLNNEEFNHINSNPLIIKGNNYNNFIISKLGSTLWLKGNLYVSFLMWQDDNNTDYDKFIYFKRELNQNNTKIVINLNNIYLSKIFVGSFGHKVPFNNYYIFFGPEGINLDELDPKNIREYPGLPYGFLLGRLGDNGTVFPISNEYSYKTKKIIKVLSF